MSLLDSAKIQDNRPGPVDLGNGHTYVGPVWKDSAGCFVIYKNNRVDVRFVVSKRQWQRDNV